MTTQQAVIEDVEPMHAGKVVCTMFSDGKMLVGTTHTGGAVLVDAADFVERVKALMETIHEQN